MKTPQPESLWKVLPAICLLLGSMGTASAQDAMVRASLADDEDLWVGEHIKLVVELLAPGYFASAASFDLPDPEGVLLMPPSSHPLVSSETIDGAHYSVQRHELMVWPMRAGNQDVPAITARFSFKRSPLDSDEVQASVTTDPIAFAVKLPPGAEDLGTVISARDIEVDDTWDTEPGSDEILAGTAFKRTVRFTAPDVPGMVFPPFPAGDIDGLGVYAKRSLNDHGNRGALTGVRQDTITYICERPGQYTIPAVTFTWFDLDSKQLKTENFPEYTLNVVANPAMASGDPSATADGTVAPERAFPWRVLAAAFAVGLAIWLALRSSRLRRFVAESIQPLKPVHLEALYPQGPAASNTGTIKPRHHIQARARH